MIDAATIGIVKVKTQQSIVQRGGSFLCLRSYTYCFRYFFF